MEELECAHCAARMEEGIRKLKGVKEASVNFLTAKLTLDVEDDMFEKVLKEAERICRKIERHCRIVAES